MKTPRENKRIKNMCHDLGNMLQSAGFYNTKVWYDEKPEVVVVEGDVEAAVNVHASSVKGCLVDIFEQLGPAIRKAAY